VGGEQVQPGQAPTLAAQRKSGGLFQWRAH
jgi:hypothetical protein